MKIRTFKKWRWMVGLVVLLFAFESPVLATGYYFHLKSPNFAYQKDGTTKIPSGSPSVVEIITGTVSAPDPAGGVKAGQSIVSTGAIGDDNVNAGEFERLYGSGDSQGIFLRIWPNGKGAGQNYGQSGQLTTSALGDNPNETPLSSITCNWKLSAPPGVNVTVGNYALSYDSPSTQYLPSFLVTPTNVGAQSNINYVLDTNNNRIHYSSIVYEICQAPNQVADWSTLRTYSSGSIKETDATNPFYVMGNYYAVRAYAINDVATSGGPYGTPVVFQIPPGIGGGGVATETWTFYRPSGSSGINTMAIPFSGLSAIEGATIAGGWQTVDVSSVGKLIAEINRQISPARVRVFGWYDAATQKHMGLTSITGYDASGIPTSGTFTGNTSLTNVVNATVSTGTSYQVSVDTDGVTFSLRGMK